MKIESWVKHFVQEQMAARCLNRAQEKRLDYKQFVGAKIRRPCDTRGQEWKSLD